MDFRLGNNEDFKVYRNGVGKDIYEKPAGGIPASDLASGVIPAPEIFWATYGTTTYQQIVDANTAGKAVMCLYNGHTYFLTNVIAQYAGFSAYWDKLAYLIKVTNADVWSAETNSLQSTYDRRSSWQTTPDNNHYPSEKLTKDSIDAVDKVFWATYGTTTASEIASALTAGKLVACQYSDKTYFCTSVISNKYYFTSLVGTINNYYLIKDIGNENWSNGSVIFEQTYNKVSTISGNESNTTKYPNTKAVADFGNIASLIPDMDNLSPIQTIEYDVETNTWRTLFELDNSAGTKSSERCGTLAFRITTTATDMAEPQVVDFLVLFTGVPGKFQTTIYNPRTPDTSAVSKYGINQVRNYNPKDIGSGYGWGMEFLTSVVTTRHIKIEIFKNDVNVVFTTQSTGITANTIYNNVSGGKSLNVLSVLNEPQFDIAGTATRAVYLNGYLNSFVNTVIFHVGENAISGNILYQSSDMKMYKASTTNKPINADVGIHFCGTTLAADAIIPYAYLRQNVGVNFADAGATYGTFVTGDEVFLRCTMSNGQIYSDGVLTNAVAPGYTWISIGAALNATRFGASTMGKQFFTLDANGKLTHINGREITYNTPIATTQPAGGLVSNILYNLGTLSSNTTFTLAVPTDANVVNHYYWTFDTSTTAPTITWPSGITWNGGSAPTINANKHYEISVLNGIGVAMEV